ncbi:MAG: tripartite tricarboxylate transporter substrate binding protein [Burkholderiales bacterium]|nr:tripartite tricarboxylate transporter substrate binding protein [Burkholderiales bacterium]
MEMTMRRRSLNKAALAALAGIAPKVWAQAGSAGWPSRPVRILVGFPAGSSPDIVARTLGESLAKVLGQPVIIENKPGASGNIAADQVAKSTDDHTLGVVINGNLTTAKTLYPKLPFDPAKDFAYLSLLTTSPLMLVAPAKSPEGAAFFAAAVQNGDKWNYGSVGPGSVGDLGMELLETKVKGLAPVHVPFKGNTEVITALISGEIQMALVPPSIAKPQVNAGKLRAIGLSSARSALAPGIPSLSEFGVRDFNLEVWAALVGPAGLSKAAQDRLDLEVPKFLHAAQTRQALLAQGWQAVGSSPGELKTRVNSEAVTMNRLIASLGIKLE